MQVVCVNYLHLFIFLSTNSEAVSLITSKTAIYLLVAEKYNSDSVLKLFY